MNVDQHNKVEPNVPKDGNINAFAIIVDLNQFTSMVQEAEKIGELIAQFTRDALYGAIKAIENEGGEVVAFMGDAILGIISDGKSAVHACIGIADDFNKQCEHISRGQIGAKEEWSFSFIPGGPMAKIAVEYGTIDISTIESRLLGEQRLLVGSPINYAARISKAGEGNRCVIGPVAAKKEFGAYQLAGPNSIQGKVGETNYEYYYFSLDGNWVDGPQNGRRFWDDTKHLRENPPTAP